MIAGEMELWQKSISHAIQKAKMANHDTNLGNVDWEKDERTESYITRGGRRVARIVSGSPHSVAIPCYSVDKSCIIVEKRQTLPGKTNKEASLTVDTGLTFEQYIEQYFISQGLDLDEKVTVRDGVITTGDLPELTIPWNQRFSVVRESAKAAEQTPGLSTPNLYFVQRKCPAELGATLSLGG